MAPIREIDHEPRIVQGLRVFIRQYIWPDGVNGYCVFPAGPDDSEPISDDDFDHMPSDDEIARLHGFRFAKITAAHHLHVLPAIGCTACEAIDPGTWRERYAEYTEATETEDGWR